MSASKEERRERLERMLAEYEAADCEDFPVWLSAMGQEDSASTCRKTRALLAQLLRGHSKAVSEAEMRFASDRGAKRVLSISDVRAVRAQLTGIDRLIFDVYSLLGLSAMEGARLEVRDVKADRMWIPGTKTDYRAAELPLPSDLAADLNALAESHRSAGRPDTHRLFFAQQTHRQWLEDVLQPAAERAGVSGMDMRLLRRTAGTLAARVTDVSTASRLLRHGTTATTQKHYLGGDDARVRAALEAVAAETRETIQ